MEGAQEARTSTRTGSDALRWASLPSVSIMTEMLNLQRHFRWHGRSGWLRHQVICIYSQTWAWRPSAR